MSDVYKAAWNLMINVEILSFVVNNITCFVETMINAFNDARTQRTALAG